MAVREANQRKIHEFLAKAYNDGRTFQLEDIRSLTNLSERSFQTYFSKHLKTVLYQTDGNGNGAFGVSEAFRKYWDWERFKGLVSQVRENKEYVCESYANVVIFEFFMPLANEAFLRMSLDSLFFRDSVERRLKMIGLDKIRYFPRKQKEEESAYLERVCDWISGRFAGYSISHVNGRFRAGGLRRSSEIYKVANPTTVRYIVDETTAVVRFIFPLGKAVKHSSVPNEKSIEKFLEDSYDGFDKAQANRTRWIFYSLFVQSIVQLANPEDEIWLLESGVVNRLHKWVQQK